MSATQLAKSSDEDLCWSFTQRLIRMFLGVIFRFRVRLGCTRLKSLLTNWALPCRLPFVAPRAFPKNQNKKLLSLKRLCEFKCSYGYSLTSSRRHSANFATKKNVARQLGNTILMEEKLMGGDESVLGHRTPAILTSNVCFSWKNRCCSSSDLVTVVLHIELSPNKMKTMRTGTLVPYRYLTRRKGRKCAYSSLKTLLTAFLSKRTRTF